MTKEQEEYLETLKKKLIIAQSERHSIFEHSEKEDKAMKEYLSFYSEILNRELAMQAVEKLGLDCYTGENKPTNKQQFGNRISGLVELEGPILKFGGQEIDFGTEENAKYLLEGIAKEGKPCLKLV